MTCTVTSWRDTLTSSCMTLFNISGTICPNYMVFVLNPMFSGSRIQKKKKLVIVTCTVTSWRDICDVILHDIVQHLRNYLPELHGFCVESYILGVKDFETWQLDVIVTTWRAIMTSRYDVVWKSPELKCLNSNGFQQNCRMNHNILEKFTNRGSSQRKFTNLRKFTNRERSSWRSSQTWGSITANMKKESQKKFPTKSEEVHI